MQQLQHKVITHSNPHTNPNLDPNIPSHHQQHQRGYEFFKQGLQPRVLDHIGGYQMPSTRLGHSGYGNVYDDLDEEMDEINESSKYRGKKKESWFEKTKNWVMKNKWGLGLAAAGALAAAYGGHSNAAAKYLKEFTDKEKILNKEKLDLEENYNKIKEQEKRAMHTLEQHNLDNKILSLAAIGKRKSVKIKKQHLEEKKKGYINNYTEYTPDHLAHLSVESLIDINNKRQCGTGGWINRDYRDCNLIHKYIEKGIGRTLDKVDAAYLQRLINSVNNVENPPKFLGILKDLYYQRKDNEAKDQHFNASVDLLDEIVTLD